MSFILFPMGMPSSVSCFQVRSQEIYIYIFVLLMKTLKSTIPADQNTPLKWFIQRLFRNWSILDSAVLFYLGIYQDFGLCSTIHLFSSISYFYFHLDYSLLIISKQEILGLIIFLCFQLSFECFYLVILIKYIKITITNRSESSREGRLIFLK